MGFWRCRRGLRAWTMRTSTRYYFALLKTRFSPVANSRILPSAVGSRHGNISLRRFVCCEFVVEMPLLFQLAKLRG